MKKTGKNGVGTMVVVELNILESKEKLIFPSIHDETWQMFHTQNVVEGKFDYLMMVYD